MKCLPPMPTPTDTHVTFIHVRICDTHRAHAHIDMHAKIETDTCTGVKADDTYGAGPESIPYPDPKTLKG